MRTKQIHNPQISLNRCNKLLNSLYAYKKRDISQVRYNPKTRGTSPENYEISDIYSEMKS